MSTLDVTKQPTLLDVAKEMGRDGDILSIAAILQKKNPILQMLSWEEANDVTSHKVLRDGSLPQGTWRGINEYVSPEDYKTNPDTEVMGILETYSQVDEAIVELYRDKQTYLMRRARKFIEGLSQTLAHTFFYGDASMNAKQFNGLAPRLAALDGKYVVGGGGTGSDLTSIYVVMPGEGSTYFIYPQGHTGAGIKRDYKGKVTETNANGEMREVYRDHFVLKAGLAVEDTRAIGRLANIESAIGTDPASGGFNEDKLIELLNNMPDGEKVICVSKNIATQMQIRTKDKTNVNFTPGSGYELSGRQTFDFAGLPVVKCESISDTESEIS